MWRGVSVLDLEPTTENDSVDGSPGTGFFGRKVQSNRQVSEFVGFQELASQSSHVKGAGHIDGPNTWAP